MAAERAEALSKLASELRTQAAREETVLNKQAELSLEAMRALAILRTKVSTVR